MDGVFQSSHLPGPLLPLFSFSLPQLTVMCAESWIRNPILTILADGADSGDSLGQLCSEPAAYLEARIAAAGTLKSFCLHKHLGPTRG